MLTKFIIIIIMLIIVGALGSALVFLVRGTNKNNNTIKALTWRIGISLTLFLFLMLAFKFHWLTPHGI